MVVPLATGVSENDDYQRACGREKPRSKAPIFSDRSPEHFDLPEAKALVSSGSDLDLSERERFLSSLNGGKEKKLVAEVECLANRPDIRFFHWELEFPEVFTGFFDANQSKIMHKDKIKKGTAGFDVVIGNPPYVRQEATKHIKPHLAVSFESFNSTSDIYAYFYDLACKLLRDGGFVGFISSGSWMKANFGRRLRGLLSRKTRLCSVIDFGEWQPFPGAEMIRPSVSVFQLGAKNDRVRVFRHLTDEDPPRDLVKTIAGAPLLECSSLGEGEWGLEDETISKLVKKMIDNGAPLREYVNGKIYRGIVNGMTDAFVIDGTTRQRLVQEHRSSKELIKPYLEGKDLRAWFTEENDRWLIFTRRGTDINDFPAVKRYLSQFKMDLTPREAGASGPGRKPGTYEWFEIQDNIAYWRAFEQTKIVWPDISKLPRFSMDHAGHYLGNTGFLIPTDDYFLLGVLSSWATWFLISRICQPLRLRGGRWQYRLFTQFMERIPIPTCGSASEKKTISGMAKSCEEFAHERYRHGQAVIARLSQELLCENESLPLGPV